MALVSDLEVQMLIEYILKVKSIIIASRLNYWYARIRFKISAKNFVLSN